MSDQRDYNNELEQLLDTYQGQMAAVRDAIVDQNTGHLTFPEKEIEDLRNTAAKITGVLASAFKEGYRLEAPREEPYIPF